MSIEITDEMVRIFSLEEARQEDLGASTGEVARRAIASVLDLPEVRQAIHDDVRREKEAKLRELGVTGYSLEWDR